jgi:hypothetical protein
MLCCVRELQTPRAVPAKDPLLDFPSEPGDVYGEPLPASASWPISQPTHTIDTTSRVISFVLGFALASLIAWLGSISGDDVAATGSSDRVATVGTPVVATAIGEKPSTFTTPEAPRRLPSAASSTPAPATVSTVSAVAAAAAPPPLRLKTAEPAEAPPRTTTRAAASGYRGALSLSSSPEGAQVVLNGKVVGKTPVVLNDLPIGSRAIVVRRDGYSSWSASVRVVAGQRTNVRATLTPAPRTGG